MKTKFLSLAMAIITVTALMICGLTSCVSDEETHQHSYVNGKCSCGEKDPNYKAPHVHNYEGGKCSCGAEDPYIVIPCTHTPSEAIRENVVDATCTATGSYEEVIKCSLCGEEISRTSKVIEKLDHTPGEATRENVVEATCTATGSYEEVVKCSLCGEEISRTAKVIEKLDHTPAAAIKENVIPATCTSAGSYDEVIKCVDCDVEISRVTKGEIMLEHKYSRGECSVCGAVDPFYTANHSHSFVDGICTGCGLTDPKYEPDYGSATVWDSTSEIHIIPADDVSTDRLYTIRDSLSTLASKVYISSVFAKEQKCELVVGYVEDREVSVKAYRLLERMEKTSYFNARYVIYAEDGKIGIAFDENEYSTLQVFDYAIEYFVKNHIEGKDYIAFGGGNRIENVVDLISKQEEIDEAKMTEVWQRLFIEAGGEENPERAKEIVAVIRKMHSMYDENVVGWFANLYDPVNGGFYVSNSGRNNEGFLPDIESTVQALSWLQSTGMLGFADDRYSNAIPEWMRNQIVAFAKSLQSPTNGYFYHPQWTQEMVDAKISRRGRDLGWATSVLKELGSAPTYNAPDGTRGDGIDEYAFWESVDWYGYIGDKSEFAEEASASLTAKLGGDVGEIVSGVISVSETVLVASDNTDYFANHENFYNYMWSLPLYDTAGISYTIGNDFNATRKQILAKSNSLGAYLDDPSKPYYGMTLCDIWIDYFNQMANPENGLWEEKTSFAGTNGLMKLYSSYTLFEECLPYPMESAKSVIYNLTSDEDPSHVCHNYNLWVSIVGIKENVRKYGDPETRDAVIAYIDEALKDSAVEMIEMTIKRVSKFKKSDGSFSYNENVNGGSSQGMPVALSINEGGINATSICMTGNFNQMLSAFGFSQIDIFGEAEWMKFCEIIDGLGPITKFTPEPIIVDFEDGEYSSFQAMRGATLDVVDYNGSRQLMMSFENLTSGWPGMDITKTLASNSGDYMVIEGDFTFMNAQDGYYEFYINASSAKPMYFQFHITGNTVKIVQSRVSSGPSFTIGARGQQIHLRLEYFLNSKGESALRINVGGAYIGTITNENKNASALGGTPPLNLNRIEFAGSYKNGGKIYIDNFNFGPDFYQDLDGDEVPDAFPDNEGAEGGGVVIPTPGATSPIDFESITEIDPTLIKISHNNYQIVEHGGSKALEVTFGADTSDEIIIYKTKSAEPEANTLVFKADITPLIEGQYNINLRNSSSTRLAHFTINNQGGETGICGAYDSDSVWQPKFCEVQKTFKLRVEYGPVEKDGKTYMQLRAYVNGELKFESKLIDKYLATDENSIRSITQLRIAENNMAQGVGTLYLDNVEFAEVLKLPETLPEDAVDEQGFVKFENMESVDASLAKAKLADTLVVTEHNEKSAMAFKYTKGVSEEFTLYPTKNEADADLMILEANVTDSYANPRVLKIYAGSRLVYDFRINGSGGFGAESNKSWWGSGKYQKDVTFNLAITVKVTDGKVDLNLYINGEKIARPTGSIGYGVNLDLSCEADLVAKISHITITDNEQPEVADTGTVYLTDYRFIKVVDDGSFVPSAPGEGGDPETPDVPVTPPYENDLSSYYVSFDGVEAISKSVMQTGSTGTPIVVGQLDGSDCAKLEFATERWDEVYMYPTYKNSSANSVIVEMDIMFDAEHASGAYATFYLRGASSEKLYILNVHSTETGFTLDDNMGASKIGISRDKFNLRIEFNEIEISGEKKCQILLYVNGELVNASKALDKTDKNKILDIGRFDILSSPTFGGVAYIDNFAFIRAFRDVKFEGELPHEHHYVDGKCECGATDPDYKPDEPVTPPADEKSIKILFFGNSYSVDATKWLSKIFLEAGYEDVIVGNVATGGCCINEHWSFLDGIEGNEPNGGDFFYTKFVDGVEVSAEDDYAFAIADEDWDIISLQHAPDELKKIDTYSHLQDFLDYILARVTNPDVKLVFHMIWAHNNVSDIKGLYNSILEITDRYVTVKTEFDGLVPSATMIEYLRDAGLTNATLNDDGTWTAGDISRDWGHMNYGLGRYAVGLLYYAYLTGESIDDFTWVPTPDMVAGTSEAQGFAEITPEKLAVIKEAIKYALANPYGENYEPKNGDGIGFPDCEMGGGETGGNPIAPDADGYISFEDMTAEGSVLAIPTIGGSLIVSEKDGSDMLEFVYSSTSTEQYKFLPTLSEAGANIMILEADIIDSYGGARTLKIMAGSRLVYDFRINGTGGFGAESNKSWWGSGHYTKDTKYNLKITVEVTDGKVDLNMYINGNKLTRPTGSIGYGVNLDLSCEDNLVELITHIDIIDGAKIAGSVYIDNYRFAKLAADDTPGEGGGDPVTPPEGGDTHEHTFVDGKCECGETDPDYKPECEHSYSEGVCTKCGAADPDYTPEGGDEPDAPASEYGTPLTFEGMDTFNTKLIKTNDYTGGAALVTYNGSKVFALTCTPDTNDEFFVYRTESDEANGDTYVFEADITADLTSGENAGGYNVSFRGPSSSKLYTLTINNAGGAYDNTSNSTKNFTPVKEAYKLRVEYGYVTVDGTKYLQGRAYVNGELKLTSQNIEVTDVNEPQDVTFVQVLEANKPVAGTIYIDNIVSRVVKLNDEHVHEFVAGKCECGELDPDYVAPEVNAEAITFENIESLSAVGISVSSEEAITVSALGDGKALKVDFANGVNENITLTPMVLADADKFVLELDITNLDAADAVSTDKAQYDIRFYSADGATASNGTLYDFRLNGPTFMSEGGGQWLGNVLPADSTTFRLRIELWVEGEALCVKVFVNGVENDKMASVFGKSYTHVTSGMTADTISSINKVEIVDSRHTANGTVYFDNIYCAAIKSAE